MSYRVIHSPKAETHWAKHIKSGDKATMKKIVRLLEELEKHPRSGTEKPEQLKHKEVETTTSISHTSASSSTKKTQFNCAFVFQNHVKIYLVPNGTFNPSFA